MQTLYGSPGEAERAQSLARRFGGVARLYGDEALQRFARSRIAVVGLGGVGTWTAEALARSGAGRLTLIDLDHVAESNTNRQIHALDPCFGMAKVEAMAERVRAIHPGADLALIEDFVTPENVATVLAGHDAVVDCTDQVRAKAALIACCRAAGRVLVTCGAAGGRRDPLRLRCDDLARTQGDPLLASVRRALRRHHGFPRSDGAARPPPFGVEAVFSDEPVAFPGACAPAGAPPGSPLACGGYGSAVTVTASMGLVAAARVLERLGAA